jgi:phosphate transport system permease protein
MNLRKQKDRLAGRAFLALSVAACLLLPAFIACLLWKSWPLVTDGAAWNALVSTDWAPQRGRFGLVTFVVGTACVTGLAMLLAVPVSFLTAIYLSEYAPPRVRAVVMPFVDLLSGIPSVLYGAFGVLILVPAVARLAEAFGASSCGYSLLAGSLVLAAMVCPFVIRVAADVLEAVPQDLRDASLSVGATRWQTVKHVVLRKAASGMTAAACLGFSRAMGETIAVLMVVGNVAAFPRSIFDPVYPLPALLANTYGEMMSIPRYDAALLFSAFLLLGLAVVFHGAAQFAVARTREAAA